MYACAGTGVDVVGIGVISKYPCNSVPYPINPSPLLLNTLPSLDHFTDLAGEDVQTNGLLENSDFLIQRAMADQNLFRTAGEE